MKKDRYGARRYTLGERSDMEKRRDMWEGGGGKNIRGLGRNEQREGRTQRIL